MPAIKPRVRRKAAGLEKDYGERDAERMIQTCGEKLDLPIEAEELCLFRKGDERKALMVDGGKHGMDCHETANGPPWFGKPPGGHRDKNRKLLKKLHELEKMYHCGD